MTKKAEIAHYKLKLASDARWAIRGLMKIYGFQTETERSQKHTHEKNGEGFTAFDAELLTDLAQRFKSRGSFTQGQLDLLFKKMPKYAGQLYRCVQHNPRPQGSTSADDYRAASRGA